jgi:hypothetical protein
MTARNGPQAPTLGAVPCAADNRFRFRRQAVQARFTPMRADTVETLALLALGLIMLWGVAGPVIKAVDELFAKRDRTDAAVRHLTEAMNQALRHGEVPPAD